MSLASGTRIGPYEILASIGAGGMGEVYRARDTRLDRTVAVKILPAEFASEARLLARFEREAKAISALNHPNICTIHDVGVDNDTNYLVMEYCNGPSLADRIARGPLQIDDVLRYAVEIVDALDKVHRRGIVHRDLKPSNIIITKSGVKLLDFGLAKDSKPPSTSGSAVTEEGQLVGTLNYMAPEVLKGAPADARSDIFSLGTVLYEMLSGKSAFAGDSRADVMASILSSTPTPLSVDAPLIEHLIGQCLKKDPNDRWQTAHDLLVELRWIRDGGAVAPSVRKRAAVPWLAFSVGLLAVLAATGVFLTRARRPVSRSYRVDLQPPPGVVIPDSNVGSALAISPDGEWVAFIGMTGDTTRAGLYLRSTRQLDARLVAPRAYNPFFSPDSKWLGYVSEGVMLRVPVTGGEPQKICNAVRLRGATWGPDGTILYSTSEGLLRVSAEGGTPTVVTRPSGGERHYWPSFLPGGEYALFTVVNGFSDSWMKIAVVSLKNGTTRPLFAGGIARYMRSGRVVCGRLGRLFVVRFDLRNLRTIGSLEPVLDDVNFYQGNGGTAFDISESGSLIYVPGAARLHDTELVWIDRDQRTTPVLDTKMPYGRASISPDGHRLAVTISSTLEDSDLWVYNLRQKTWTRFTFAQHVGQPSPPSSGCPVWTPDGQWIIGLSGQAGHPNLFRVRADGTGKPEALTSGREWEISPAVSPDGRFMLFGREMQPGQWDIMSMSLDPPGAPRPFLATPNLEFFPSFSPDGRWVAYESFESGSRQIHVRRSDGSGPSVRVSTDTGWTPRWSRDGREIFYQKLREVWSVRVKTAPVFQASEPVLLFRIPTMAVADSFDISLDGTKFLMVRRPAEERSERRLVFVPNWADELTRAENAH